MKTFVKGMTALQIGRMNLIPMLMVAQQAVAEGQGPVNQVVSAQRDPKTFRVGLDAMKMGTKVKPSGDPAERLDPLPPIAASIEMITEGEYAGAVKCTITEYGWPVVKDKEEKKGAVKTGRIVKQLSLASTRSAVPIMTENAEGERERLLFDITVPSDVEGGEPVRYQFAAAVIAHFYGKDVRSVTKRQKQPAAQ